MPKRKSFIGIEVLFRNIIYTVYVNRKKRSSCCVNCPYHHVFSGPDSRWEKISRCVLDKVRTGNNWPILTKDPEFNNGLYYFRSKQCLRAEKRRNKI